MDLVKTLLLYMMMLVNTATGVSPDVTPMPASALPTPTPYVTQAPVTPGPVFTATPRPTRYTTLYVGDKGNNVRALQNRLIELGYLTGSADGSYGAQTKTAVERFQRANGLKVDGIAGRNTQQIMFESPDVVYARAVPTLIPTIVPVTPTPVAPALVSVRYVDISTGALLNQATVQCYANTNVYANPNMVPSAYNLVSNSYVYIQVANSIASPSTVTFYYQRNATAAPSTGVSVPIYYLDSSNRIVARENRMVYQSGAVAADTSLIPAGYTLSGSSVVYVTLSGSTVSPNPILFRLNSSLPTATPVPVSGVVVPVNYVNAVTGAVIASQSVTLYRTSTIYPQQNLVPSGYTLVGNSYATVTVTNGRANPSSVTFRYQPAATPVVGVTLPVNYIDNSNRVVYSTSVTLAASQLVYANMSLLPGYSLTSASSVYVTVRNGTASPASVTFRVAPTATPTPVITQVSVQVRYMYGSRLIGSQTVYLRTGTTSYVYADESVYGSGYVVSGATSARVIVSAAGIASPSIVTFNVVPRATATPAPTAVPVFYVNVPVRYQYGTRVIASQDVSVQNGTTITINADPAVYSRDYDLTGASSARVTVSVTGVANPSSVTFYLTPKTTPAPAPTAVPISEVPVTVRYMSGTNLIASYQEVCPINATTTVRADPSIYEGSYTLQGDDHVNVKVDANGNAQPPFISFYLIPIAPDPVTPPPAFPVPVPVEYRYGNTVIYNTVVMLESGSQTTVNADASALPQGYVFEGSQRVTVTVSADGVASPSPVVFSVRPNVEPITPAPVTQPPAPTPVPGPPSYSGDLNQELPKPLNGVLNANYPVYQGPGTNFYRSNSGKASYGKGGNARIYGTDGEWLLIGYGLSNGDYRIGYIHNYTLPEKIDPASVQRLTYAGVETTIVKEGPVTDDPIMNTKQIDRVTVGTPVTFLAWTDSTHRWALIEYQSPNRGPIRAFIGGSYLACMQ